MSDTSVEPTAGSGIVKSFADFNVEQSICDSLADAGITSPFPIQELTLPLALSGADLIGQARTGTGKTLAFGIPLVHRVDMSKSQTQALVIVPTRELCIQVRDDLAAAAARKGAVVVAAYGGRSIEPQIEAISKGAPIVVGTPGRLLDLLRRGVMDLSHVGGLVLDEADEMLDLGFLPDVEQLIQACAPQRQTLLFSATMPSAVVALARRYMTKPTFLRADSDQGQAGVGPDTVQHFFSCHRMDKPAVLARILQTPTRGSCIVFTRTKRMADVLAEELRAMGVNAAPIHSDLRQEARERALTKFRKGSISVLVATEVAARGLDISDVTHVVNYDCPDDEKMYLHRVGRTGRAGAAGVAITFAVWNELARLDMIKRELGVTTPTHEVFSTSPILDELFDLPSRDAAPQVEAAEVEDEVEVQTTADGADETAAPRTNRRRRRGGRRRSAAVTTDPAADEPAALMADEPAAPVDDAAAETVEGDADATADAPEATGIEPADGEQPRDEEPADGEQPVREVRTRRRRRTVRTSEPVADDSPDSSGEPDAPVQPAGDAVTSQKPAAGQRQRSGSPRRQSSRSGGGQRRSVGSGASGASERSGRRGESARGSRSPETSRGGSRERRPRRTVDSAVARGTGKPALTRPLQIIHLP